MEFTEDQLSGWFDVSAQKPWDQGVYELTGAGFNCFAFWDGKAFSYAWRSSFDRAKERAIEYKGTLRQPEWFVRMTKWRGISSDPSAPKKRAGNKRKTLYRVFAIGRFDFQHFMLAGFFSTKEAIAFIKHRSALDKDLKFEIRPLRFRTPEA